MMLAFKLFYIKRVCDVSLSWDDCEHKHHVIESSLWDTDTATATTHDDMK